MASKIFSIIAQTGLTVSLTIQRASDSYYWTGTAWQAGAATVAMTETVIVAGTYSEYSSTTDPTARCFWFALDQNSVMLDRNEYVGAGSLSETSGAGWPPSLADIKDHLGIDSDNTDRDTLLTLCRNKAQARVERYCQRKFSSASRTYYLDGSGTMYLPLPDYPITAVISIHIDTEYPRSWDAADLVDSDYYQIEYGSSDQNDELKSRIQRIDGGAWGRGAQNIRAIATTGYSSIPDDLYWGALELAVFMFTTAENKRIGVTSKSEAGGSIGYDLEKAAIPLIVRDRINPFRATGAFGL